MGLACLTIVVEYCPSCNRANFICQMKFALLQLKAIGPNLIGSIVMKYGPTSQENRYAGH